MSAGAARQTVKMISGKRRPSASGHRFGPDLDCIDCGMSWELHQMEPEVCTRRDMRVAHETEPSPERAVPE